MGDRDRLDEALEALISNRSPARHAAGLNRDEQQLLAMAQLVKGSDPAPPDSHFVGVLKGRLRRRRVSRRTAFLSSIAALAAGVAAGLGLNRLPVLIGSGAGEPVAPRPSAGRWYHVASVADVPEGAVHAFVAGSVQGFVLRRQGRLTALSRTCTHMGCALRYRASAEALVCPCHGAEFDLTGAFLSGPGSRYAQPLNPLPRLDVRIRGNSIQVFAV